MTVKDIAEKTGFEIIAGEDGAERDIECVYCCDLLSFAMSKAPLGSAWVTVMNNINVMAVASLSDVACVVLAEGVVLGSQAAEKANEHGISVLKSKLPAFETAKLIYDNIC